MHTLWTFQGYRLSGHGPVKVSSINFDLPGSTLCALSPLSPREVGIADQETAFYTVVLLLYYTSNRRTCWKVERPKGGIS